MWPVLKAAESGAGVRPLTADETRTVAGGETKSSNSRKAGQGQQDYLVVTMSNTLIGGCSL